MNSYKLEAPEGGWGFFVCLGMSLPFISGLAAMPSFGLIFNDFLKSINAETSAIAFITSGFFCALSFAGLFSGSLFRLFGLRPVGMIGAVLYFLGSFAQVFATSILHLIAAFSIMQGIGFGLIMTTSYATFNNYFLKNRVIWMSFAQSVIGFGCMLYPIVVETLLTRYGFRGCLLVLTALNSHALLGMLLMHPVEWHMRKIVITDCHIEKSRQELGLLQNKLSFATNKEDDRVAMSNDIPRKWSEPIRDRQISFEITYNAPTSCESSIKQSVLTLFKKTFNNLWQTTINYLDLSLLKQPIYINIVMGMSFALYSDITFFTLQPIYLFELGFNKANIATVIAVGAAADMISRIILAISAIFINISPRNIYLVGAFFTVVTRFVFIRAFEYINMVLVTALMGFFRTWIHVPLPLVFAEYLPKEKFASGYGLFMFLQGNIMFLIGPFIGKIRDATRNYVLTFHLLTFFMALCPVSWLLEKLYLKINKNK